MTDQNSQFFAMLTAVGEARQANADALGIAWKITQMGVGDANGTEPTPDRLQTALLNERRRAPLNQLKVDPGNASIIIAEQVIPEDVGGWWIREIGLYDEAGDLVAIANCAPSFKPQLSQGSGRTQVVRMNLIVSSATNVELKIDPSVVLATRKYVDDEMAKRDHKNSVRAATTAAIVLSGTQTVDGIALVVGDRVLVKDQAAGATNGIYVVAGGAWARAADADASIEVTPGMLVPVEQGTANADSVWQLATDGAIVLGTTALAFEASAGPSGVSAGSYRSVTVDKRGRVTGGTNPAELMALSRVTSLSVSGPIAADQMGLLLLDATGGDRTFTLPAANGALGVVELLLRRVDVTSNALVIAADGTDTLMLDTTAEAAGQASTELLFAGDYLRLRSNGAGKWWCVGQAQLPGSIASGLDVFSATGTYTVPAVLRSGRRRAKVTVIGAGGGGALSNTSASPPAGGSGGAVAVKVCLLTAVTSVAVTVGAGGAGGSANPGAGSTGGSSSFGAYCSAAGGGGGPVNGNLGSAPIGAGGDINYSLGYGSVALRIASDTSFVGGYGGGGSSPAASSGAGPLAPGHGGGGRLSVSQAGENGQVKIEW